MDGTRWESGRIGAEGTSGLAGAKAGRIAEHTALGENNWLFIGHPQAGWRSAVIYSMIVSCRRHGIDPWEYVRDVLNRLPGMKQSQLPIPQLRYAALLGTERLASKLNRFWRLLCHSAHVPHRTVTGEPRVVRAAGNRIGVPTGPTGRLASGS